MLIGNNAPVIVVLFNAGPVNVFWADAHAGVMAIVECFYPAQTAGEALRRVLTLDGPNANPAGRLPFTWPASEKQVSVGAQEGFYAT
jgi:beta-glucosidase